MKKFLMTLVVALTFCGSILAQQHPETHWPGFNLYAYEMQGALYASLMVNGEPVDVNYPDWDVMEVAAFVGDEMRMTGMFLTDEYLEYGELFPTLNAEPIYYTTPGEEVTFKMYNHATGVEYGECHAIIWDDGTEITILTGEEHWEGFDDPDHPLMLNFICEEPPTPTEYIWNVTEGEWTAPEPGADVTIPDNSIVTIPATCIAVAGNITLGTNSQIIIEDGGQLYHNDEVQVTMQINVQGYEDTKDGDGGYRLIASPINQNVEILGTGLVDGALYDLYYFNQEEVGGEWINYKDGSGTPGQFTTLDITKGYLYASPNDVLALFAGPTIPTSGYQEVPMDYVEGVPLAGWNLLGNPYTSKAYVDKEYYVLNPAGSELITGTDEDITPLMGIFVQATGLGQTCTFTTTPPTGKSALNITVTKNGQTVDVAKLSFSDNTLEKFQFNPYHTKIYMSVEGKDFAVAKADNKGEMPVCFKAQENSSYTLNFNAKEVEFSYLHLIDYVTGNDVDLLENPSYSFDAQTTDIVSRFKLVYTMGTTGVEEDFGFISNGSLMIFGIEGEATLQVIDVTGRIISTETFNGYYSKAINETSGVYLLRLIQGNNIRTQKIVVK